jgi:hypothetical protein
MTKILKLFWLLSIILFQGCKDKPVGDLPIVNITKEANHPVFLSELGNVKEKIPLETKEGVFLRFVFDVKIHKDKLLISDSKSVSIFNFDGNFIQKLGSHGDGPGEYRSVNSMTIDEDTGHIYLATYRKILVFDSNYQFLDERNLGYPIVFIKFLAGDFWVVSEEIGLKLGEKLANQTNIYKLDKDFMITDTIPFRTIVMDQKSIGSYPFRHWISDIDKGVFMFMPVLTPENLLRDTLYRIEDKMVIPSFRFNFDRKQSLDESDYQTLLLYNIVNSKSYFILEYDQDWKRYMFLYDKKNKIGYNLREGLIDDEGEPVFLRPLDLKQDLFYYVKSVSFKDKSIEEQNPLIGIVKLK